MGAKISLFFRKLTYDVIIYDSYSGSNHNYVAEKISAVFFDNFNAFSYIQYIIITRNNKWLLEFSFLFLN